MLFSLKGEIFIFPVYLLENFLMQKISIRRRFKCSLKAVMLHTCVYTSIAAMVPNRLGSYLKCIIGV